MIRCPGCGRRLPESAPVCAAHGEAPPPAAAGPVDAEADEGQGFSGDVEATVRNALRERGFETECVLGQGGFGVVLSGQRMSDGAAVAVKVGLVEGGAAAEEMAHETAAMGKAAGPHVPQVFWTGAAAGRPCMVLERVTAPTLASRMESNAREPMTLEESVATVLGLIDAVEQVHQAGLVHLDLKPENVFVDPQGRVTLIDFGLARAIDEVRPPPETAGAEPVGTAEYMSPEQCDDAPDLDGRSDLYSVGVLIYEILSGAPPFWGKPADVREAQRSKRVPPLPRRGGLSTGVDAVVRRCLAKDRARRYASMGELRTALREALAVRALSSPPPGQDNPREPSRRPAARRASAGVKEKHKLGLLFFTSKSSIQDLRPLLADGGGEIAQNKGEQYTVAFGHDVSENPAKPALALAHRLVTSKHAERVLVDVATVTVQFRPDGTRRYFGAALMKRDRMPTAEDPAGVSFTQSAVDVLGDLEFKSISGSDDRFVIGERPKGEGAHTTFGTRSTPLIGRVEVIEKVLDGARNALEHCVPTLVDIGGKPGYGRTHLAGTLADRLERVFPGALVMRMAAQEAVLGSRGRVLRELLRALLQLPEKAEPEQARALFESALGESTGAQVWAAGAFAMGYIPASHPAVDKLAAAPGALRSATARALGEALRLRAQQSPVCVLLDDAHLADDAVLDGFEYAALHEGAPVFACLFVPDTFREDRANFAKRAGGSVSLQLEPLAEEDAIVLARLLLRPVEHVPQGVLQKLLERTQRVPRLMFELVRGLKRDGIVRRNPHGTGYHVATDELDNLPDLPIVQWNARREVEALPKQLGGHARLASVLGAEFGVRELEEMVGVLERRGAAEDDMELDPAVGLDRLEGAQILRRHASGNYSFRYPLLRETIYALVSKERCKVLHAAALEVYEQAVEMADDHRRPRIALHAARSGQREKAAQAYLELGRELLEAQAYLPAEAAFGGALENLEEDDGRWVEAAHGRGLMRFRLSRNEDALADLTRAREKAHESKQIEREADILLDEATVLDWRLKLDESAELVRQAQMLVVEPDPRLAARLAGNMARVHHRAGESKKCVEVGVKAAEQAASLGEAGYETRVIALLMAGVDCVKLGMMEEAERQFEVIVREAEAHADLHHLAAACINRCFVWHALRRRDRIIEDLSRASNIARDIGEGFLEFMASYNLSESLFSTAEAPVHPSSSMRVEDMEDRDLHRAYEAAGRAWAVGQQLWGESVQALSGRLMLARIAAYAGDIEALREHLEMIRSNVVGPDGAPIEDANWGDLEQELTAAVEFYVEPPPVFDGHALEQRLQQRNLEPAERLEVLELHARGLLRVGRLDEARGAYHRAAALATEEDNPLSERVLRDFEREFSTPSTTPATG